MIIVHHLNTSRSQRVLWLLEELGVPYELKKYQRDPQTMLAPAALRQVHPLGKSPVISEDGVTVAESGARAQAQAAFEDLTPREREVVLGIARGDTNAEISARLFMSVATVKAHITHILTKLGATNRTQIALLAHDAGLI